MIDIGQINRDFCTDQWRKKNGLKILLIEAGNEANNGLLASFSTKSSDILVIFTRHLIRAKVSSSINSGVYEWNIHNSAIDWKRVIYYFLQEECASFSSFSTSVM